MLKSLELIKIDPSVYSHLIEKDLQLQIWESYYQVRKINLQILFNILRLKRVDNFLEIGCGIGYVSALLATNFKQIYAVDLPYVNQKLHSKGLSSIKIIVSELNLKNIHIIGANASSLPIKSNTIDLVMSLYTLEHLPVGTRNQILTEIRRVMKVTSYAIFILPNFLERIYNLPRFYFNLARRLYLKLLFKNTSNLIKHFKKAGDLKNIDWQSLLFPTCHGFYSNSFEEFYYHLPYNWINLFHRNKLNVLKIFTIEWTVPWQDELTVSFYEKTKNITIKTGDKFPFKYLGHSIGFLISK